MIVNTSELTGALLDAAVAKSEGMTKRSIRANVAPKFLARDSSFECNATEDGEHGDEFEPSDRWDHGGPIIAREQITIRWRDPNAASDTGYWAAMKNADSPQSPSAFWMVGATVLIAAMRAFVYAKNGAEVDL